MTGTVNFVDIAVVLILLTAGVIGFVRGLFISLVNLGRSVVGTALCFFCARVLPPVLFDVFFRQRCYDYILDKLVNTGNIDTVIQNLNNFFASQPKLIQSMIDIQSIDITSKDIAENILNNIFEPLIVGILKAVVFILVFILFFVLTGVLLHLYKKRRKKQEEKRGHKSLARKTDMLLGAAFSLVKAFVLVFAFQAVLLFAADMIENKDSGFVQQVHNSVLLSLIQPINLLI